MKTLFDTTTVAFSQYEMLLLPGAALLVTIFIVLRDGARKWQFIMGGVTLLLFLLAFVLPVADFHHVQSAAHGPDIRTVEGVISDHSRVTERRFSGTSRGVGFPSNASFTNAGDPPWGLADGQRVRIRYFEDPWFEGQRRITKIEAAEARWTPGAVTADPKARPVRSDASGADPQFQAFWTRFSAAAAKGDAAGVKALTRFPFLFAGTPLDAARFDSIWMGIFPAPNRPCFSSVQPVRDGAAWSVSCGVYVYVFEKGADGWKLASFTADPEAE